MKTILICVLVSLLVHIAVFFCLDHSVSRVYLNHPSRQFEPLLLEINQKIETSKEASVGLSGQHRRQVETSNVNLTKQEFNKDAISKSLANSYQAPNNDVGPTVLTKQAVETTSLVNYLGPDLIDRKALPLANIDRSMLTDYTYSGFPIRLRLYINSAGNLMKIERITVLDQDVLFVEALEKLLSSLHFLPAKRDGQDVNSYQDVEFSFGLKVEN